MHWAPKEGPGAVGHHHAEDNTTAVAYAQASSLGITRARQLKSQLPR